MSQPGYPVPAGEAEAEVVDRRSRFIARAAAAATVEAAKDFVAASRQRFPDASHHVYAFAVGHGATLTCGMSDDGEPSGTAGRPVLAVLQGSGMGDVVVVVARYFGGTKLGTGGLVRAYTAAAQAVLARVPTERKVRRCAVRLLLPYDCFEACRRAAVDLGARLAEESFGAEVELRLEVAEAALDELRSRVRDLTSGRVAVQLEEPPAGPE